MLLTPKHCREVCSSLVPLVVVSQVTCCHRTITGIVPVVCVLLLGECLLFQVGDITRGNSFLFMNIRLLLYVFLEAAIKEIVDFVNNSSASSFHLNKCFLTARE